jgi:HEAT repeat protein
MPLVRSNSDKPGVDRAAGDPRAALLTASPEERWAAARKIAQTRAGVTLLAEALGLEKDPRVREAIFTGLASIATPESALAILPHLRSDDANLRTGALDALRMMPDATRPILKTLLGDPDSDVRLLACDLLRGQPAARAERVRRGGRCAGGGRRGAGDPFPHALRRSLPVGSLFELRH